MRLIPGLVVIDPCDAIEIAAATEAIAEHRAGLHAPAARGGAGGPRPRTIASRSAGRGSCARAGTSASSPRPDDRAGARRRRGPLARGIAAGVLHVPTIKPFDAAAVTAFAAWRRPLVGREPRGVGGSPASSSRPCSTPALLAGHAARPARPLHRMRLGADAAGPIRPDRRGDPRLCRGAGMKITGVDTYTSAPAGRTGSSCASTPMPASTASAKARSTASSPPPKPACTSSNISQSARTLDGSPRSRSACRQRLARRRPYPSHRHRRGRGRLLGHPRQIARRAGPPAPGRQGSRQRARLRQRLVSRRAHARSLPCAGGRGHRKGV